MTEKLELISSICICAGMLLLAVNLPVFGFMYNILGCFGYSIIALEKRMYYMLLMNIVLIGFNTLGIVINLI